MDNLGKVGIFLKIYNIPRLNYTEIENMNKPITSKEIKSITKNLPIKRKGSGVNGFTGEFYQKIQEKLMPVLSKS